MRGLILSGTARDNAGFSHVHLHYKIIDDKIAMEQHKGKKKKKAEKNTPQFYFYLNH